MGVIFSDVNNSSTGNLDELKAGHSKSDSTPARNTLSSLSRRTEGLEKDLQQYVKKLRDEADTVSLDFKKLESDMRSLQTFLYIIVTAMIIGFLFTVVLISIDYFNNNEARYEKFLDKLEDNNKNFYSKSEVDSLNQNFKTCILYKGLNNCLR